MSFVNRKTRCSRPARNVAAVLMLGFALAAPGQSASGQPLACRYDVAAVIQAPPGPFSPSPTFGNGISPNGQYVVGSFRFDGIGEDRGFFWSEKTGFVVLPLPPGAYAFTPADINDARVICGTGLISGIGQRGYVLDMESNIWTELPPLPGGAWSGANAITANGTVCGFRSIGSKGDPVNPFTAFVSSPEHGIVDLGVMNGPNSAAMGITDDGTVVGWTGAGETTAGTRGFVWHNGQATILPAIPGGLGSALRSVNAHGIACGHGRTPNPAGGTDLVRAFVWQDKVIQPIGVLPGMLRSFAFDIADDGAVVGFCRALETGGDVFRAYGWSDGRMRDLNALVEPGSSLTSIRIARSISIGGKITGEASASGQGVAFVLAPVYGNEGDVDDNCHTDVDDLILVILEWGEGPSPADANGDGVVDLEDLLVVIGNWSE